MAKVGTVLVAAGSSERLASILPKQFLPLGPDPMFVLALRAVLDSSDEVVIAARPEFVGTVRALLRGAGATGDMVLDGTPIKVVKGGSRRQDSVRRGLEALSEDVDIVLIHDAARPFASRELVASVVEAVEEYGAVVPAVSVPDTVKRVEDGAIVATLDRSVLQLAQTPQGFTRETIVGAYAALGDADVTDDARAVELYGRDVAVIPGEPGNFKITTPVDLELASMVANCRIGLGPGYRAGMGTDTHRLVEGRKLVLCGVTVPFEKGLDGHSDADVATHAVCDALLGAIARGDIGLHFPPDDPEYKDISSLVLLERVVEMVRATGRRVVNVDVTVVAEAPKLAPHVEEMRETLASAIGIEVEDVSVKATTTEGTGPEGEGRAISSVAVAVVREPRRGARPA